MAFNLVNFFPDPDYPQSKPLKKNALLKAYAVIFTFFWIFSGITATDFPNWILENSLTIPAVVIIAVLHQKVPLSNLSYTFILLFLLLHLYGSQNAYAENPFGFWLQEIMQQSRNNYDRLVHFCFGFLLGFPFQELLYQAFETRKWRLYARPVELILSLSAAYEIIEWVVAGVLFPEAGMAFLGAQGDVWDAQKDMFLATAGAFITMSIVLIFCQIKYRSMKQPVIAADKSSFPFA